MRRVLFGGLAGAVGVAAALGTLALIQRVPAGFLVSYPLLHYAPRLAFFGAGLGLLWLFDRFGWLDEVYSEPALNLGGPSGTDAPGTPRRWRSERFELMTGRPPEK